MAFIKIYVIICVTIGIIAGVIEGVRRGLGRPMESAENEAGDIPDTKARRALWTAYMSLKKQHAARYGPWLSTCLSMPDTPPEVALQALYKVRSELSSPRYEREGEPTIYYDLGGVDKAIDDLEVEMEGRG